jgi:hypothetical protein
MTTRRGVVLPHLVLADADVTCEPSDGWSVVDDALIGAGSVLRDGDLVESWDALKPLHLARTVTPPPDIAQRLGLDPDTARFAVIVVGTTGRGMHRTLLCSIELHGARAPLRLEVRPRGDHLLRDLNLSTGVVLVDPGVGGAPLAPSAKGARIWEDVVRFQLEGGRARLPMEVLSFRSTPAFRSFENALFHVHVAADEGLAIEQAILVHLNSDQPAFVSRVVAREPVATAFLWDGIVRQTLREVLAHEMTPTDARLGDTLDGTARRWLEMAFRGRSIDEVANLARERPAEFDAMVESWCGSVQRLFRDAEGE